MKEILLTQDQVALVDDEDFERVNQWKWFASWNPCMESFYAVRNNDSCSRIYMARFVMNCPDDLLVDHESHNTLDNQKNNLRVCTYTQNNQNSRARVSTTSQYKGVHWRKDAQKWRAQIRLRDIFDRSFPLTLGHFDIEEEAALAYDEAAIKHFGEFAYLNFPRQK